MVKTPRTRHSRTEKKPVTIDLAPNEVSRVEATNSPDSASTTKSGASASEKKAEAKVTGPKIAGTPEAQIPEAKIPEAKIPEAKASEAKAAETKAPENKTSETKTPETKSPAQKATGTKPDDPAPASSQPHATTSHGRERGHEQRRGRGGALLAGLAGGVAALALAAGLQFAGILPQGTPASLPETASENIDHAPAIAALETQLTQLREEISTLRGSNGSDAALAGRVAQAEERVTTLAAGLESLKDQVDSLAAPAPGATVATDLAPFEERIAKVESELASIPEASAAEAAIASLRSELAAGQAGVAQSASRLDTLEAAVQALTGRVDEQAKAPATALIIAASSLKAAIDRGTSFTAELDTYEALAPDAPQLSALRDLAAAGVPTRAQIAAASDAAANAMIAAARPVDPQAGIGDRLWNSMMGLVQVRPIGMVEGDGVPEIVARLDAAVQAGDYERALAEYDTLPPEAKAAGEAFIARLRARHSADQLADEALAAALKA